MVEMADNFLMQKAIVRSSMESKIVKVGRHRGADSLVENGEE